MLHSCHGLPRNTQEGIWRTERSIRQVIKGTKLLKFGIEVAFVKLLGESLKYENDLKESKLSNDFVQIKTN